MSEKIKLLAYGDAGPTGFGQVTEYVLEGLQATGRYNIVEVPINWQPGKSREIEGVSLIPPDGDFALGSLHKAIRMFQPEIVWCICDMEILSGVLLRTEPNEIPVVAYVPVEGVVIADVHLEALERCAAVVPMSHFGASVIQASNRYQDVEAPVHHGVDSEVFYAMPEVRRREIRAKNGWSKTFVVANVNMFNPRKMLGATIRAFALFYHGAKGCIECGHVYPIWRSFCDLNGCTEHKVLWEGAKDSVLYLHTQERTPYAGNRPSTDLQSLIRSVNLPVGTVLLPHQYRLADWEYTKEDLNRVYNAADVFMSTTLGEGFGLTALEALRTACPVLVPNNTTAAEVLGSYGGTLVANDALVWLPHDFTPGRPIVSVAGMLQGLIDLYKIWQVAGTTRTPALRLAAGRVAKDFPWSDVSKRFDAILQRVAAQTSPAYIERGDFLKHVSAMVQNFEHDPHRRILITMPGDFGDVLLLTRTLNALLRKFPDVTLYVGTKSKHFPLLEKMSRVCPLPWEDALADHVRMQAWFDIVYTPHLVTQEGYPNWVHMGTGPSLAEVYARACDVDMDEFEASHYTTPFEFCSIPLPDVYITVHTGTGKGNQLARRYYRWPEAISGLASFGRIVQVGGKDDIDAEADMDLRGKLSFGEVADVLERARVHVGIDSFPMHLATIRRTPVVALYSNTYPQNTGPDRFLRRLLYPVEPSSRFSCTHPCCSVVCQLDRWNPCINNIKPEEVVEATRKVLRLIEATQEKDNAPESAKTVAP